jgi:rubrerythrin
MERELATSGVIFQAKGSCGISNQEALGSLKRNPGIFNTMFAKAATSNHESFFNCPRCHKAISSGLGITVCPHCGAKKEDYGKCV